MNLKARMCGTGVPSPLVRLSVLSDMCSLHSIQHTQSDKCACRSIHASRFVINTPPQMTMINVDDVCCYVPG